MKIILQMNRQEYKSYVHQKCEKTKINKGQQSYFTHKILESTKAYYWQIIEKNTYLGLCTRVLLRLKLQNSYISQ